MLYQSQDPHHSVNRCLQHLTAKCLSNWTTWLGSIEERWNNLLLCRSLWIKRLFIMLSLHSPSPVFLLSSPDFSNFRGCCSVSSSFLADRYPKPSPQTKSHHTKIALSAPHIWPTLQNMGTYHGSFGWHWQGICPAAISCRLLHPTRVPHGQQARCSGSRDQVQIQHLHQSLGHGFRSQQRRRLRQAQGTCR